MRRLNKHTDKEEFWARRVWTFKFIGTSYRIVDMGSTCPDIKQTRTGGHESGHVCLKLKILLRIFSMQKIGFDYSTVQCCCYSLYLADNVKLHQRIAIRIALCSTDTIYVLKLPNTHRACDLYNGLWDQCLNYICNVPHDQ